MQRIVTVLLTLALFLSLSAWGGGAVAAQPGAGTGTVYALTNSFVKNEVVIYDRADNGALTEAGRVDTGGIGTNVFESSTGMLLLGSAAGQSSPVDLGGGSDLLFAANAGSDNISVFQVTPTGLRLVELAPSGGERPISLTVRNGLLYVLNSGGALTGAGLCNAGTPTISGFRVSADGQLTPLPNSTRSLSGGISAGCTQVSFNPAGNVLIVTQWVGNRIDAFTIGADGVPTGPIVNQPAGANENPYGSGPFGFTFDKGGRMLASQNFAQQLGLGGAASYTVGSDGRITPIGGVVHNGSTDPCWMAITPDGRFAYMQQFGPVPFANVGVSPKDRRGFTGSFQVGADGALTSLDPQAADVGVGGADLAIAGGGRFLYARNSIVGTIKGFRIEGDGRLTLVTTVAGLPTNGPGGPVGSGLVARDASAPSTTFSDVPAGHPNHAAITALAARGIIRGYGDGRFGPEDPILRAQMAAIIARAQGWDGQEHGNPFSDRGSVDADLWRNVGTLAFYDVAQGFGDGTYKPTAQVLQAQTISLISRAMVAAGVWQTQPDDGSLYPNVPLASGHRADLATYVRYAGAVPGTTPRAAWGGWNGASPRGWAAQALWQALETMR